MRKMLLAVIVAAAIATAGWFGLRLWPLVAANDAGAEQVVLLHGLGRVVQLGSPNGGSEMADAGMALKLAQVLMDQAGPAAQALVTGPDGFAASLPEPDYPVGVIAGTQGNLLSDQWLPLPNDGLVSVQSARLEGMTDFVTVDASHWQLRNRRDVAELTVRFLRSGAF